MEMSVAFLIFSQDDIPYFDDDDNLLLYSNIYFFNLFPCYSMSVGECVPDKSSFSLICRVHNLHLPLGGFFASKWAQWVGGGWWATTGGPQPVASFAIL